MTGKKTKWYLDELVFLKKEFQNYTHKQLLDRLNAKRVKPITSTVLRNKCRELGLLKFQKLAPWNERETKFLAENFRSMGNIEIAEKLNRYKSHTRLFTKKHIEKKLKLLQLHRSVEDRELIKQRHIRQGVYSKPRYKEDHHLYRPEGKKWIRRHGRNKYWFIKKNGEVHFLHRYLYEKHIGPLDSKKCVSFKDGNTLNCDLENLYQTTRGKHGRLHKKQAADLSGFDPFLEDNKVTAKSYVPKVYSIPNIRQLVDC